MTTDEKDNKNTTLSKGFPVPLAKGQNLEAYLANTSGVTGKCCFCGADTTRVRFSRNNKSVMLLHCKKSCKKSVTNNNRILKGKRR